MKNVIVGLFKQETNRYAPGLSGLKAFKSRRYFFTEKAIRDYFGTAKSEITGFFSVLDPLEEINVIPVVAANASPGPVVAQCIWDEVSAALLKAVEETPVVDGILLALHGAMVTEEYEDGEGELLELLRNKVGPTVPIITSLDLHANLTQKMMDNATALFAYDYYPHTDLYETGVRAANCMKRVLLDGLKPAMAWRKLDMIFPYVPTAHEPFIPLLQEAQSYREKDGFVDVTICHGFFPSDIYDQGAAILAITENDITAAQAVADSLGDKVFAAKETLVRRFLTIDEAVDTAMKAEEYPVVIADVADNPGAGASADSTRLLKALLDAGATDVAIAFIYDPETALQAEQAGVGSTIEVNLGGKTAPEVTGGPLPCTAYVKALTDGRYINRDKMGQGLPGDLGKTALLIINGIQVIVGSVHNQPWDVEVYRHCGIHPEDMKILVVKSTAHYRHSYGKIAKQLLEADSPALSPMSVAALPLAHSRRPIWPLD